MNKHLTTLDGLRGLAILLVLSTHLLPYRAGHGVLLRLLNGLAGCGWMGVDLFFALSGFLITGILLDTKGAPYYFRNFYMRRTLRIVPLYVVLVFVCMEILPRFRTAAQAAPSAHRWMFWVYLSNVLIAFRGAVPVGWLGPLWSLAVEEHFYLVWPAAIFLLSRRGVLFACACAVLVANGCRVLFAWSGNLLGAYVFSLSRIDTLALGAVAALLIRSSLPREQLRHLCRSAALCFGLPAVAVLLWRHAVILDAVTLTLGLMLIGASSAALLLLAVLPGVAYRWQRVLNLPLLRVFGKYSYGLYLLHVPVSELMHRCHLLLPASGRAADLTNLLLQIALSLLAAWVSFHLLESPFLRLKRFFPSDPVAQDATAVFTRPLLTRAHLAGEVHSL